MSPALFVSKEDARCCMESNSDKPWLELRVEVDREAVEPVSELLSRYGYQNGIVIQEPIVDELAWGDYVTDPEKPVVLIAYIRDEDSNNSTLHKIREGLWHLSLIRPIGELQTTVIHEQDWTESWKHFYQVTRIGKRIVIKPTWMNYEPKDTDIVVELDPGMAFGTGLHPTTRLCLRAIEEYMSRDIEALDLGTGSGILAAAMAQLGASRVVAVDTDPVAVDAAKATALRNQIEDIVHVWRGSLDSTSGHFGFIAANIIPRVIIDLAEDLAGCLTPGGMLVASGITADRYDEVALWLSAAGLHIRDMLREGDWIAIVTRKGDE